MRALLAAVGTVALVGAGLAQTGKQTSGKVVTATGTVVDLYCYDPVTKANRGIDHREGKNCAYACARWEGQPVGLLTDDGHLYQLAGGLVADSNIKIAPYMADVVTITGSVAPNAGIDILTSNDLTLVSGKIYNPPSNLK